MKGKTMLAAGRFVPFREPRENACPRCGGDGYIEYDDGPRTLSIRTCAECGGAGTIEVEL